MTRAVFFDAGHTLIYAHPGLGSIYEETTRDFGVRVPAERFSEVFIPVFKESTREYSGTTTASDAQDLAMWREITKRIYDRIPHLAAIRFQDWFESLYRRFGDPRVWRFYQDVEPALRTLRARGIKIGIISNWDTRLRTISDGLGLTPMVDFLIISAEAGVRKPSPGIFRLALEKAGVRPEEAVHVGDLPEEDGEGARRAGLRPVLIDRKERVTPVTHPPHFPVVRGLEELLLLL
ncbi:MAG TPA: HAD-IA family hydrolase [Planctomycetota bacterium]|nr:HAD-IA family hydrolase [Planctomycetota bacterium]